MWKTSEAGRIKMANSHIFSLLRPLVVATTFLLSLPIFLPLMPALQAASEDGDARSSTSKAADATSDAVAIQTSPFDPPTEDTFVTDDGPGLDTGCTFNTDPNHPLVIDIVIDKFVGDVDASGFLVAVNK